MRKKRLNQILNTLMGSVSGVFLGYCLYSFWHYRTYPGLYVMQSAPWYTGCLLYGAVAAAVLLLSLVLKLIFRKTGKL